MNWYYDEDGNEHEGKYHEKGSGESTYSSNQYDGVTSNRLLYDDNGGHIHQGYNSTTCQEFIDTRKSREWSLQNVEEECFLVFLFHYIWYILYIKQCLESKMFKQIDYEMFLELFGDYYKYDSKIILLKNKEAVVLLKENSNSYILIKDDEIFLHKLDFFKNFKMIRKAMSDNGFKGSYLYRKLGNKKSDEVLDSLKVEFLNYEETILDNCFAKDFGPHDVKSHVALYKFTV